MEKTTFAYGKTLPWSVQFLECGAERSKENQEIILADTLAYLLNHQITFIKVVRRMVQGEFGMMSGLKATKEATDAIHYAVDVLCDEVREHQKKFEEEARLADVREAFLALSSEDRLKFVGEANHLVRREADEAARKEAEAAWAEWDSGPVPEIEC